MNATQVKYARERAKGIYSRKVEAIKAKHTVKEVRLTEADRRKALKEGRFKALPSSPHRGYNYIEDYVQFDGEVPSSFNKELADKEITTLSTQYDTLIDQLVLGDSSEALRMLEQFEKDIA